MMDWLDCYTLEDLEEVCRNHGLSYTFEFTEDAGNYELRVSGIGRGEEWYIKKSSRLSEAIGYIFSMMPDVYFKEVGFIPPRLTSPAENPGTAQ